MAGATSSSSDMEERESESLRYVFLRFSGIETASMIGGRGARGCYEEAFT